MLRAAERIEFFRHALGDAEKRLVLEALDETILTTGRFVEQAEAALARYLDLRHVVCLDSCTAALHLALVGLGVGPGDEVVVPALTFAATANAVLMAGARPVFADVDAHTACLTPATVEPHLTPRTRAIVPVHLYGLLCDMKALKSLADQRGLLIVEDSAHCLEARRGGVRPGSHGACACFSFYATKALTCGEGGALATNDEALASRVRRLSLHGMDAPAAERYRRRFRHWDMVEFGWKYNLDNIRGALLVPQIGRLDAHWARRQEIAERYDAAFGELEGVELLQAGEPGWSARHIYPILVAAERRDAIIDHLMDAGIGVAVNYRAVPRLSFYARTLDTRPGDFPVAESIGAREISLPIYPGLSDAAVERVIEAVAEAVAACSRTTAAQPVGAAPG